MFHFMEKPKPAEVGRARDHRPRGRFLRAGQRAGKLLVHHHVELAQEVDRLEVLAPAVFVGHPFAGLARIVQIEHRGHRIHAQAVGVELGQPVVRARQQETSALRCARS